MGRIITSNGIGPTCIYGEHEIGEIIREGAQVKGYKSVTISSAESMKLEDATRVAVTTTIIKEK